MPVNKNPQTPKPDIALPSQTTPARRQVPGAGKRLRIVNDHGRPMMTRIFDAETGEDLSQVLMVQKITIDIEKGEIYATLRCVEPTFDLLVTGEIEDDS